MRTAWPATRPAHSFLKFRAYPLNVLPSGLRFLDGDNPADPLIAREWRNILPLCPRHRVRTEDFPQIRRNTVYSTRGDCFLGHGFHSTSPPQLFLSLLCSWAVTFPFFLFPILLAHGFGPIPAARQLGVFCFRGSALTPSGTQLQSSRPRTIWTFFARKAHGPTKILPCQSQTARFARMPLGGTKTCRSAVEAFPTRSPLSH